MAESKSADEMAREVHAEIQSLRKRLWTLTDLEQKLTQPPKRRAGNSRGPVRTNRKKKG